MTEKQTITVKYYGGGFVAVDDAGLVLGRGATDDEARQQAEAKRAREKETDIPK